VLLQHAPARDRLAAARALAEARVCGSAFTGYRAWRPLDGLRRLALSGRSAVACGSQHHGRRLRSQLGVPVPFPLTPAAEHLRPEDFWLPGIARCPA